MTTVNMDQVWDAIKPRALELVIDGTKYQTRRLTVGDARRIADFAQNSDDDNKRWLVGLFMDKPPKFVEAMGQAMDEEALLENKLRVLTVLDALGMYYLEHESLGKKLEAAHLILVERMRPPVVEGSSTGSLSG